MAGWLADTRARPRTHTHLRSPAPSLPPGFLPLRCSVAPYRITAVCQPALFLSIHPIVTTLSSASVPPEASNLSYTLAAFCTSLSFILACLIPFSPFSFSLFSSFLLSVPSSAVLSALFLSLAVSLHLSLSPVSTGHSSCCIVWCSVLLSVYSSQRWRQPWIHTEKTVTGSGAYSKPCWLASCVWLTDSLASLPPLGILILTNRSPCANRGDNVARP